MNRRAHVIFLVTASVGALAGAALWSKWGTMIWIADFVGGWCG